MKAGTVVTLWKLFCDDQFLYFITKLEAEKAARILFPDEAPDRRYARISYLESAPYNPE
jgi:hypothetical protein